MCVPRGGMCVCIWVGHVCPHVGLYKQGDVKYDDGEKYDYNPGHGTMCKEPWLYDMLSLSIVSYVEL